MTGSGDKPMADAAHADEAGSPGPAEGVAPLVDELGQLAGEARAYAAAELAFQRSRVAVVGIAARKIALYGLMALVFVVFAIGGLTVGLIMALTPLVTAWGATAVVAGLWLLVAVVFVRGALSAWTRMRIAITGERDGRT